MYEFNTMLHHPTIGRKLFDEAFEQRDHVPTEHALLSLS
jgi:hypothetical protein